MIGWLNGRIADREQPGRLVIDVNGVGYDVETSLTTFFQIEHSTQAIQLHIHTVVREDALLLYGFLDKSERALFRSLIKVSGIGPKSAIAILSSITPADFVNCIRDRNATMLTRLPGIGKKTAERLLIEMGDGLDSLGQLSGPQSVNPAAYSQTYEAISALVALGYKEAEASKVIKKLDDGHKTSEQLIRQALQAFAVC